MPKSHCNSNQECASIILLAFRGACPDGMETRHLDGNKNNNVIGNLAWGTQRENNQDRLKHGGNVNHLGNRPGEQNSVAKLKNSDIPAIRKRLETGEWASSIARDYCVTKWCICNIRQGATWKGF